MINKLCRIYPTRLTGCSFHTLNLIIDVPSYRIQEENLDLRNRNNDFVFIFYKEKHYDNDVLIIIDFEI